VRTPTSVDGLGKGVDPSIGVQTPVLTPQSKVAPNGRPSRVRCSFKSSRNGHPAALTLRARLRHWRDYSITSSARLHRQVSEALPTYVYKYIRDNVGKVARPRWGDQKCRSCGNLGINAGIVSKSCLAARVYARTARHFKTGAGSLLSVRRTWRCSQPLYLLQRPFLL
jgi:hypothetical protein